MQKINDTDLVTAIIACTTIFLLLTSFIISFIFLYQKRKLKHLIEVAKLKQENERELLKTQLEAREETLNILGKELHDNIGQLLNSTKLLIGVTQRKLNSVPETLLIAEETLGNAISDLRSLSKSLNTDWLQQFNFIENLQNEIKRINASRILYVQFSNNSILPLNCEEQIVLFRIVQEALQNAIKHAEAKNILIELNTAKNSHQVIIADDGIGFVKTNKIYNSGILNMQHRCKVLGGNIKWETSSKGTSVYIQLPLKVI